MNNNVKNVLSYMLGNKKYTFVDMLCSADFSGLSTFAIMEGNGIKGCTGEIIQFQCSTLSRGTNRELQLRSYDKSTNKTTVDEHLTIGDLFPGHEVVILTSGDSIRGFAPVFDDKLDLALWLRDLKKWFASLSEDNRGAFYQSLEDMVDLAKFLYRNNPNKVASVLDDL